MARGLLGEMAALANVLDPGSYTKARPCSHVRPENCRVTPTEKNRGHILTMVSDGQECNDDELSSYLLFDSLCRLPPAE